MVQDSHLPLTSLRVDGGASNNGYLMQFQSDLLQRTIERPVITETTALGAAHLAGLAVGYWKMEDFAGKSEGAALFTPKMDADQADVCYAKWVKAVQAARLFSAK